MSIIKGCVLIPFLLFNDEMFLNSPTTGLKNLLCGVKLNRRPLAQYFLRAKVPNTHLTQVIQFNLSNPAYLDLFLFIL